MTRITFAADEHLLAAAREQAKADHSTLSEQFRHWLEAYAGRREGARAMQVMERMGKHFSSGGQKLTREELNERR